MATPIGRLAAAVGSEAAGFNAHGLVTYVIENLGLTEPGETDTAEGAAAEEGPAVQAADG